MKLDPGHWSQVMLNLAINARDAMPDFGGVLTIRTFAVAADTAFLAARPGMPAGSYAAFSVSDNGAGIAPTSAAGSSSHSSPPKLSAREPASAWPSSTASSRRWAALSRVDTATGRGTTFTVYLPTVTAPARDESHFSETSSSGAGESVLIVEDEDNVRELLQSALTERGYRVVSAPSGDEAMRLVDDGVAVDLLVTDMVMPGAMNGRIGTEEKRR